MSCMGWVTGRSGNGFQPLPGRAGLGSLQMRVGRGSDWVTLVPGHVGSLLSASGSRREEKAPPPPPFPHDVRRSRCATSSSPSPSYPPRHPLPRRSTARPSRISRPPPPWPPPGVASGGDPCWGCAGAIPTTFLAPHTLYFIP